MAFGKRFKAYMKRYPNVNPTANRCSELPYVELRSMAKNLYFENNESKEYLQKYQNMKHQDLSNAVYHAMGTLV